MCVDQSIGRFVLRTRFDRWISGFYLSFTRLFNRIELLLDYITAGFVPFACSVLPFVYVVPEMKLLAAPSLLLSAKRHVLSFAFLVHCVLSALCSCCRGTKKKNCLTVSVLRRQLR